MLSYDIAAILPELRAQAEARMTSTCSIAHPTGQGTDPITGAVVTTYSAPIYVGRCRVKSPRSMALSANAGETQVVQSRPELHVPMSATGLRAGDVATITAVDPVVGDPDNLGRTLRIDSPFYGDDSTSRRFLCTGEGF